MDAWEGFLFLFRSYSADLVDTYRDTRLYIIIYYEPKEQLISCQFLRDCLFLSSPDFYTRLTFERYLLAARQT